MVQIIAGGTEPNSGGNVQVIQQVQTANWSQLEGKPFITVATKGIENGLSSILNDGNDFGPDTKLNATAPGQYGSGGDYTKTYGIHESYTYCKANELAIELRGGTFIVKSSVQWDVNSNTSVPVNMKGQGRMLTTIQASTGGIDIISLSGTGTLYNTVFEGFTLDSNALAAHGLNLNMTETSARNTIRDVGFINSFSTCGADLSGSEDTIIDNCFFGVYQSSTNSTVDLIVSNISGNVTIQHSRFFGSKIQVAFQSIMMSDCTGNSIEITQASYNLQVTGCYFNNTGVTEWLILSGGSLTACTLTNIVMNVPSSFTFINNSSHPIGQLTIDTLNWFNGGNFTFVSTKGSLYSFKYVGITTTVNRTLTNADFVFGTSGNYNLIALAPSNFTSAITSGSPTQNTYRYAYRIYLPVYATTPGTPGTVKISLGTTSSPGAIATKFISGSTTSTETDLIELYVPVGLYYEFTGSGVTFETATIVPQAWW